MMLLKKLKKEQKLARAFRTLFLAADGGLKPEAAAVLEFLRDEAGARGELGRDGVPYFYDAQNRFDPCAAAFLLGKRRLFDLIVKYLSLSESDIFALRSTLRREEEDADAEDDDLAKRVFL